MNKIFHQIFSEQIPGYAATHTCLYCGEHRNNMEGWHDCRPAQDRKAQTDEEVDKLLRVAYRQSRKTK
jgi:hypothetical protein